MKMPELKRRAKEYVEMEADTTVRSVRFHRRYRLFGREDVVLRVATTDKGDPNWWVIGGGSPMNLYSIKDFPEADAAYSLHRGLLLRMSARDFEESGEAPDDIGYDAFISHATEDKATLVKPLATALKKRGLKIWYDEFELRVGDSLRESIDKGLASSRYGIVILSKSFFAKKWPKYELNGLTAREMDGKKLILPIWHKVTKTDILKYSPPLADRVALDSSRMTLAQIVKELAEALEA